MNAARARNGSASAALRWAQGLALALMTFALGWPALAAPACPGFDEAGSGSAHGITECKIGAYVVGLHGIDTARGSFGADLWLWTNCPAASDHPNGLRFLEVLNAEAKMDDIEDHRTLDQRGDLCWGSLKLSGNFRHAFDLRNFPFDRQVLTIDLEESEDDIRSFRLLIDRVGSGLKPELALDGWQIDGAHAFDIVPKPSTYVTNFGDPSLTAEQSIYSGAQIKIAIKRADWQSFIRLTIPVYIAAILALLTFLMQPDGDSFINPRLTILAGLILAVVFNMRESEQDIGMSGGFSLLDQVHFIAFALIFAATFVCSLWRFLGANGVSHKLLNRLDYVLLAAFAVLYVVANALAINAAAHGLS